jgi:adenylate kinase
LNEEFNLFRGLFPLKVFIGGPPASGKSHFTKLLAESYGIPHLKINDMVEHAKKLKDEIGEEIRNKVEELKDIEVEKYEKTRKKKDPDLDRNTIKVRFPDEIVNKIVKAHVSSPACMNKGFILDGYPRNCNDAKAIFCDPIPGYEDDKEEEKMEEEKKDGDEK